MPLNFKLLLRHTRAVAEDVLGAEPYRRIARSTQTPKHDGGSPSHVIVCAPGGGNIGDQAMFEAYLENVDGPTIAIVGSKFDVQIPQEDADRVTLLELPALLYGPLSSHHFSDFRKALNAAAESKSVSLVGADIMDGAYNPRASLRRIALMRHLDSISVTRQILGFSWNGKASPWIVRSLRRASQSGLSLMVRDPRSAERARADGFANVHDVADLVFAASSKRPVASLQAAITGRRVALINISGHIEESTPQIEEYAAIVQKVLSEGFHPVLVAHVSRTGSDDVVLIRELAERLSDSTEVTVVDYLLRPAEVRWLCGEAALIVTGRMHLSIIGLSQGVPAIILASQGKVEGLADRFPGYSAAIQPGPGFAKRVIERIDSMRDISTPMAEMAPYIADSSRLAQLNFGGCR